METHYISAENLRTQLQVTALLMRTKDNVSMEMARPAALSTNDPKRRLSGGWKTPYSRDVEAAVAYIKREYPDSWRDILTNFVQKNLPPSHRITKLDGQ